MVVVTILTKRGAKLVVSAYDVKSADGQVVNEEQLRAKLQIIKDAYEEMNRDEENGQADLLLANRHHEL